MLLHDPLDFHALNRGGNCFAQCEGVQITYAEAKARSERLAAGFAAAGVVRGDRFGVLMRNATDFLLLIYAASRLGAVPVPLNHRLAPREWAHILEDAGASAVVADSEYAVKLDAALEAEARANMLRVCTSEEIEGWRRLEDFIAQAPSFAPSDGASSDILLQIYTSGTTGSPKGAMLSHDNVLANIFQTSLATPHKLNFGERTLVALPLFHVAALSSALGAASGGGCLWIHRDVDPMAIAKSLVEDEIVVASLVPAVIQFLLTGVPGLSELRFPHLKFVGYGASPISEPVLRRAMEVFDCHVAQGYGMTELAGGCTMLSEADHRRALAERPDLLMSAGRKMPGCEVRIVGPEDEDLPPGVTGEILVRGAQVMVGYWKRPEATAESLRGGWLHTGDAGYLDEEGYLFIRDRIKDMIVSGAENVYPAEVEAALHQHPLVADVAVIGVPDARWGETVMAVIVSQAGQSLDQEELDAFCRARLGGFKIPRRYAFVEALPRNASGKILKRELREQYWSGEARRVS